MNTVKNSSANKKIVLSSVAMPRYWRDLGKSLQLKRYCIQKNIDFIDRSNINKKQLGLK